MNSAEHMIFLLAEGEACAIDYFRLRAQAFMRAGGAVSWERCCRVGATAQSRKRAMRNALLYNAARLPVWQGRCASPTELLAAIRSFRDDEWRQWKHMANAPESASDLHCQLFLAFRHGLPPDTTQGIGKILRACNETASG